MPQASQSLPYLAKERLTQRLTTVIDLEIAKLPPRDQLWAYAEVMLWISEAIQYIARTRGRRSALTGRSHEKAARRRPRVVP